MFCAVYDALGTMHSIVNYIFKSGYTAEQSEAMINYYLSVADYRYRLYLDLLLSMRDTPKECWPVPSWYAIKSTYGIR